MNLNKLNQQEIITYFNKLLPLEIQHNLLLKHITDAPLRWGPYHFHTTFGHTEFGKIGLVLANETLYWNWVYPLSKVDFLTSESLSKGRDCNDRKSFGLGLVAHVKTLLETYSLEPSVAKLSVTSYEPSPFRREQLRKMNIDPDKEIPFPKYLHSSVNYANSKGFDFKLPF